MLKTIKITQIARVDNQLIETLARMGMVRNEVSNFLVFCLFSFLEQVFFGNNLSAPSV